MHGTQFTDLMAWPIVFHERGAIIPERGCCGVAMRPSDSDVLVQFFKFCQFTFTFVNQYDFTQPQ